MMNVLCIVIYSDTFVLRSLLAATCLLFCRIGNISLKRKINLKIFNFEPFPEQYLTTKCYFSLIKTLGPFGTCCICDAVPL